jgi:hypothetical protein
LVERVCHRGLNARLVALPVYYRLSVCLVISFSLSLSLSLWRLLAITFCGFTEVAHESYPKDLSTSPRLGGLCLSLVSGPTVARDQFYFWLASFSLFPHVSRGCVFSFFLMRFPLLHPLCLRRCSHLADGQSHPPQQAGVDLANERGEKTPAMSELLGLVEAFRVKRAYSQQI